MEQIKIKSSKKSLYLLLCAILGMILFVIVQQAALLLLTILMMNQLSAIDLAPAQSAMFDSLTYLLAMFFGAWYGIWLGLHWYEIVYEQGRKGVFHAFLGRLAGGNKDAKSVEEKTPIMARPQPQPKQAARPQAAAKPANSTWRFEDLARLRPVMPRPQRTDSLSTDSEWSKKVSVKPATPKRSVAKPSNSKQASKSAGQGRKVATKAVSQTI